MVSAKKKPSLLTAMILFLLVPTLHAAQLLADANGTGADADGERVTAREGVAGGHAHGYSGHNTNNQGGGGGAARTRTVDPRNLAARGRPHRGGAAASKALGPPCLAFCGGLGAAFLAVLL